MKRCFAGCWFAFILVVGCAGFARAAAPPALPEPVTLGRIIDVQGLVSLRPVNGDRWTPVTGELAVVPGDWLRTDNRGANAVRVRLGNGGSVILGPNSQVEFAESASLRISRGELEVSPGKEAPLTCGIPGDTADKLLTPMTCKESTVLRVKDATLTRLDREPLWLQGFKGSVVKESMGELLVNVDGRDIALTVGYHKVTVDIRDQIARTVIEESFVNHTTSQLEGIFHFPLPADASISDFGMWINDELVKADVVEKQRAREIYETILRERRDPGLLEWTGGNIFKARVFPIFPHSEKRVTLTYTQVLPLRNGVCRYTYPLQSEMLRQKPLRELQMTVNLYSAVPLKNVRCTSHPARIRQTTNAASVEYAAQEVTPEKDFELLFEPEVEKQPLAVIPHQRGKDGYFLLLLTPPAERAARPLLFGGEPTRLILLADTSNSMDPAQRVNQAAFLKTLLTSLRDSDRFMLAACDVDCTWLTPEFTKPGDAEIAKALDALAARRSLGWSDLDRSFAAAAAKADGKCQLVYLGDGIIATAEIDPVAFAKRIPQIFADAVAKGLSCHAVATGTAYEAPVMKALAAQGGGSFRKIEGDAGPIKAGLELLEELTRPPVRELALAFKGLRAAKIYPEELPNLPAGMQQVIVGLYQSSSLARNATVRVTGKVGDKLIAFEQPLRLPKGEKGNDFIPRLWARHHLDVLLEQGASPEVRDEIVGFSQEYRIMTPYTSFLVLESDADRERFGVKRHFAMRDGEAFFAEAREKGNYQLLQAQIKKAAGWRAGLRRQVLADLADLGRSLPLFPGGYSDAGYTIADMAGSGGTMWGFPSGSSAMGPRSVVTASPASAFSLSLNGSMNGAADFRGNKWSGAKNRESRINEVFAMTGPAAAGDDLSMFDDESSTISEDRISAPEESADLKEKADKLLSLDADSRDFFAEADEPMPVSAPMAEKASQLQTLSYARREMGAADKSLRFKLANGSFSGGTTVFDNISGDMRRAAGERYRKSIVSKSAIRGGPYDAWNASGEQWLNYWLPNLQPEQPAVPVPEKAPVTWTAEAYQLAVSLDRQPALSASKAIVQVLQTTRSVNLQEPGKEGLQSSTLTLAGPERWFQFTFGDYGIPLLTWRTAEELATVTLPYKVGRSRKPLANAQPVNPLARVQDWSMMPLFTTYAKWRCSVQPAGADRVELVLSLPDSRSIIMHLQIDTARHVLLEQWNENAGKITSRTRFLDFKQVAGCWWATRVEQVNADNQVISTTTVDVSTVTSAEADKSWAVIRKVADEAIMVPAPLPTMLVAKRAEAAGKAKPADTIALISHYAALQQWDRAATCLEQLRGKLKGKAGFRYLQFGFQLQARRNEELRTGVLTAARELVAQGLGDTSWQKLAPAGSLPERCGELAFAQALLDRAGQFQANEVLALLDEFKPLFDRQLPRLDAKTDWLRRRANGLRNANQPDAALAIEADMVRTRPWDSNILTQYAQSLANTGAFDQAAALLTDAMAKPQPTWADYVATSLRQTLLNIYQNAGLQDRQIPVYEATMNNPKPPADSWFYQQYLGSLVKAGRDADAEKRVNEWLVPVQKPAAELTPVELARVTAAARYMMGNYDTGYGYGNGMDEKWLEPLAQLVRSTAGSPKTVSVAQSIMSSSRFNTTDTARGLRAEFAKTMAGDTSSLDVTLLRTYVTWISINDPAVEADAWRLITANLEKRWSVELAKLTPEAKTDLATPSMIQLADLGDLTATALRNHVSTEEFLRFARRQLAEGPALQHDAYSLVLFDALLAQPWKLDYEDNAFELLYSFLPDANPEDRLAVQVQALLLLTDWMVESRQAAVIDAYTNSKPLPAGSGDGEQLKAVPAKPLHELTRSEQKKLNLLARDISREAAAARLAAELKQKPGTLRPWLDLERLDLLTRLNRAPSILAGDVLELLGPPPPAEFATPLDQALFLRCLTLGEALAVKETGMIAKRDPKAGPGPIAKSLLKYCRSGLPTDDEIRRDFWRDQIYRLLLALDQPVELETELRAWLKSDDTFSGWRITLAYLLAETNHLKDAVAMLEAVEKEDELDVATYRTLANWYLALGDQDKYHAARLKMLEAAPEYELSNRVNAERNKLQRYDYNSSKSGIPPTLDPQIVEILTVLLRKSQSPNNYSWYLQDLYRKTRDFQLLRCLAEAVPGHTAQQIYPFLQQIRSLLQEILDEATADQLVATIGEVRKRAETAVDRRALFLLEAEVKRRASEVLNQPGQHVPAALAALQAAFHEVWVPGEPRLAAEYLASLGNITQKPLADEQLKQLKLLYDRKGETAVDRLHIVHAYAQALWNYSQRPEALDTLTRALDEYRATTDNVLTSEANEAFGSLLAWCRQQKECKRGETLLRTELGRPANPGQRDWLGQQLCGYYMETLMMDGETALGSGDVLYAATRAEIVKELTRAEARPNGIQALINTFCQLITRAAHEKKLAGTADHIRDFATNTMPILLPRLSREPYSYQNPVNSVAQALHDIAGARDAIAFLLTCSETEPAWFRFQGYAFWQQHAWRLGEWRKQVQDLGDLEPRLLAVVLKALREDMLTLQTRNRSMYARHNSYFWEEKAQVFADTAIELCSQNRESGSRLTHITAYLFNDLDLYDKAIEILTDAWKRAVLDEKGQAQLATFLQARERWAESLPVLDKLVQLRPDTMLYHSQTIVGLAKSNRRDEALAAYDQAVKHFKARELWHEQEISTLAQGCLTAELFKEAAAVYDEVIALHRRTAPAAPNGDGTLSGYYANLARAHAGLGDTAAAVDAAAGAIISWGRNSGNRNNAVSSLTEILRQAKDLDGYVAQLDAQTAKTGLDNPIVRKGLGLAYAYKNAPDKAIVQLRLALQGQPNDEVTHQQLVMALDALKKPEEALNALIDEAALLPRDLKVRRQVYERFVALQQTAEAERAATGIVEAAPTEAENHQAMAELRQQQNRWADAIPHWQRVSELRALEPTGLLGLAQAQLHLQHFDEARTTLNQLLAKPWPERFNNVRNQAQMLLQQANR